MQAYGQKNKNISYNIIDCSLLWENSSWVTDKKIENILSDMEGADGHKLKLREIPVVKDTNDNFVYMDVNVYYGTYAYLIPQSNDTVDTSTVKLFSVTGGLKANSYATVQDIGTITEHTVLNNLTRVENEKIKTQKAGSVVNSSVSGYTFTFDGNDYFIDNNLHYATDTISTTTWPPLTTTLTDGFKETLKPFIQEVLKEMLENEGFILGRLPGDK